MYDHHTKAGNPGDVVKHVALVAAANTLMPAAGDTFHYADTHAGYALNPLCSGGEWRNGIGLVHADKHTFGNSDVQFWHGLWECECGLEGSAYPGSSAFVRKVCMRNRVSYRPRLWDISSAVISQLMTAYSHQEAEIYPRPACVDDFKGLATDLLLIDPPDFADVDKALSFLDVVENVILWLPVTFVDNVETEASSVAYQNCQGAGVDIATIMWGGGKSTRGCRLVCRLPQGARLALENAVIEVCRATGWGWESSWAGML